ncbi:MAG: hypothetical protein AAGG11_09690 [Pseudomonadota bacterium]
MSAEQKPKNDFFVGYLSNGWGGATVVIVAVFLLSGLGLSAWVAQAQQAAGQGQWQVAERRATTGYLTLAPYPVLHTLETPSRSILLVRPGKASAAALARPLAGQLVTVRGAPIERGGWSMLEVYADTDLEAADPTLPVPTLHDPEVLGEVRFEGEIVDSKCFLGVMKPGAGKVHRACAALCLTGGMPPMLVVTDAAGDRYGYVLINEDGSSASLRLVPDVAMPVAVTGQLERHADLLYLRIGAAAIQRL